MIYKVMGNVKHNGKVLKKGSNVDFSDDEAKPLLELGVIADPEAKEEVAAGGLTKEERKVKDAARKKKGKKKTDDTEDSDDSEDEDDGLDAMTVPNLKKLAKKEDVEVTGNKPDIVAAIRAARESDDDADKL